MTLAILSSVAATVDLLRRALGMKQNCRVLWVAASGVDALERCASAPPDVLLLDLADRNAVDTTRRIMAVAPCAILLVRANAGIAAERAFEAMGCGAIDAVDVPLIAGVDVRQSAAPLLTKIDALSLLLASGRGLIDTGGRADAGARSRHDRLVVVGASAGGPAILTMLLSQLPGDFPAALVIVQHVDQQFAEGMAEWLNQDSALSVRVAREGDKLTAGEVLLAGTDDHLTMTSADRVGYTADPKDYPYRPSVDVFFKSVCRWWPGDVVGVLLTGMGRDGALGLKALRDRGAYTIAQDEATSAVYGMPQAAVALGAAVDQLAAARIAPKLLEVLMCKPEARVIAGPSA